MVSKLKASKVEMSKGRVKLNKLKLNKETAKDLSPGEKKKIRGGKSKKGSDGATVGCVPK